MSLKKYIIANVKKKFWLRLLVFSLFLAVWLVIDEWIKEGYAFHPIEVINPLCHEFWVIVFVIIGILSAYKSKYGGESDELAK